MEQSSKYGMHRGTPNQNCATYSLENRTTSLLLLSLLLLWPQHLYSPRSLVRTLIKSHCGTHCWNFKCTAAESMSSVGHVYLSRSTWTPNKSDTWKWTSKRQGTQMPSNKKMQDNVIICKSNMQTMQRKTIPLSSKKRQVKNHAKSHAKQSEHP